MKKLIVILYLLSQSIFLYAQTITGTLVDQNSVGLSGFQLQLYIFPYVFSTTSDASGSFIFNNVTEVRENKLPVGYSVSDNFPNPFNPKTRIYITLPKSGNVKVKVYNILGQKVLADINRYFNVGTSYLDLELKGLPNGIYIATISIDEKYKVVKKLMLLYGSQHLNTSVVEPHYSNQFQSLSKISLSMKIDSIVIYHSEVVNDINNYIKNVYADLPLFNGVSLTLSNLYVNTKTTGTPCYGIPTITYAGQTYHTVQIGGKCWLRENLNVGTMIDSTKDQTNNSIIEKYCYHDDPNNCAIYGGLYQWAEAVQYQNGATNSTLTSPSLTGNVQGICPTGWHIPSNTEYEVLNTSVYDNGNALKAVGQGIVDSWGDGRGTNTSGFSSLLAGIRLTNQSFLDLGFYTNFWSSTETNTGYAYSMNLSYNIITIDWFMNNFKDYGFSVRCHKD